ncbi:MAG: hypothetical protein BWK77_03040 [Verrucomicrobia bacterium A1]|nr:MAG: hypothetical protein BWK77_03040 [Verrucomicrobia bacterium A1]
MKTSLTGFSQRWQEALLDFLWRSWSALGVQGHKARASSRILDPEALILFTCGIGRRDPRLFDKMLDWVSLHERLINVQRLRTLLSRESFSGGTVMAALAHFMGRPKTAAKWRRLAQSSATPKAEEPLFSFGDGRPLPIVKTPDPAFAKAGLLRDKPELRHHTRVFDPDRPENLILKLRALFGVNSRAELTAFLLTHDHVNASEAARQTGYFQRTAYNALVEMKLSGLLRVTERGGENLYSLKRDDWEAFLGIKTGPRWTNWPPVLSALETIWLKTRDPEWAARGYLKLALDLHLLIKDITPRLQAACLDDRLTAKAGGADEAFVETSLRNLEGLLDGLGDGDG